MHDPKRLTQTALESFVSSTRHLGSAPADDGVVSLGWSDLFARPVVLQVQEPPEGIVLALGMEVFGKLLSRPMRDISVGVAATPEAAIDLALQGFLGGPYAALHDALSDQAVPYHYAITQTMPATENAVEWAIFESPLQTGGADEPRAQLAEKLGTKPLFVRLAESRTMPPLDPEHVHWLKLHAAREGDRPAYYECVYDGAPWEAGREVLSRFDWPEDKAPQTFRQYWVFTLN